MRTLIKHDFDEAFKRCDVIVTPTAPTTAFKIGEKTQDPLQMYLVGHLHDLGQSGGLAGAFAALRL